VPEVKNFDQAPVLVNAIENLDGKVNHHPSFAPILQPFSPGRLVVPENVGKKNL
jgi:hypothetical protein